MRKNLLGQYKQNKLVDLFLASRQLESYLSTAI